MYRDLYMTPREQLVREEQELQRLLHVREEIETAIAKTKRRIAAWAELCDDTETGEPVIELDLGGLTEACRTVMRSSRKPWMTIAEIQESLGELGFPLKEYRAPTASITTTVNRLVEAGEVVVDKRPRANEYKWVGSIRQLSELAKTADVRQRAKDESDNVPDRWKKY